MAASLSDQSWRIDCALERVCLSEMDAPLRVASLRNMDSNSGRSGPFPIFLQRGMRIADRGKRGSQHFGPKKLLDLTKLFASQVRGL